MQLRHVHCLVLLCTLLVAIWITNGLSSPSCPVSVTANARSQCLSQMKVNPARESSAQLAPVASISTSLAATALRQQPEATVIDHSGMTGLPVAFLMADADPAAFTDEENGLITAAQQQFAATMAMAATQETASPRYYKAWLRARQMCDDWLRVRLGQDDFNRFSSIATQEMERMKKP